MAGSVVRDWWPHASAEKQRILKRAEIWASRTLSQGTVQVLRWISEPVENGLGLRVAWIEARVTNTKKDQGSQQIASGNKAAELAKTGAELDAVHSEQVAEDA